MRPNTVEGIAIIGMTGRFPGARCVEEFWSNLKSGVESITFLPEPEGKEERKFARGVLEDAEYFDAPFFGFTPKEAELTDPQQRIFLECCWEALENAGYDAERVTSNIGLFAGTRMNTYLISNLAANRNLAELDPLLVLLGNAAASASGCLFWLPGRKPEQL